jgi:outer membrane beta-barrel protein
VARATALFLAQAFRAKSLGLRVLAAVTVAALSSGLAGAVAIAAPGAGALKAPENPFQERGKNAGTAEASPADDASSSDDDPGGESVDEDATAAEDPAASGGESSDEDGGALRGLACLEGDATGGRRKGVQRRDFLKRHRFELSGVGGYYASDVLSSTYTYGGAVAFFPSEDFGLELLVTRSPVKFRLEEPFNAFDNLQRFQGGAAWQGIASLLWSPIHAKFKFTEATIVHADIFAVAGAGRTFHDTVLGLTWEAGFGVKLYFSRLVTFRLDVRDFLLPQEVLGRGRITNNINILAGFSVWLG